MDFFLIIKICIVIALMAYAGGFLAAWLYEVRLTTLYRTYCRQVAFLRQLPVSAAVLSVKMFKLNQDYQKISDGLYRRQRFVRQHLLFLGKSTLKNNPLLSSKL